MTFREIFNIQYPLATSGVNFFLKFFKSWWKLSETPGKLVIWRKNSCALVCSSVLAFYKVTNKAFSTRAYFFFNLYLTICKIRNHMEFLGAGYFYWLFWWSRWYHETLVHFGIIFFHFFRYEVTDLLCSIIKHIVSDYCLF